MSTPAVKRVLIASLGIVLLSIASVPSEIHEAIKQHDLKALQKILRESPQALSQRDSDNFMPLHLAAMNGELDMCKILIDAGANPNESTDPAASVQPVDAAAVQGKRVNQLSGSYQAAVLSAAGLTGGFSPIHLAAQAGHEDVVALLLASGADPNQRDPLQQTALHCAVANDHPEVALLLIGKGADTGARENHGKTPLLYAAEERLVSVVLALLKAKADPKARDDRGMTALFYCIDWSLHGMDDVPYPTTASAQLTRMLAPVSDVNAEFEFGNSKVTALHIATYYMQYEIAKILLENKADPNKTLGNGSTALDMADLIVFSTYDDNGKPTDESKVGISIQRLLKKYGAKNRTPWQMEF